jgi:hypothetical protein
MRRLRWQDMVNLVLGLVIAVAPWALGLANEMPLATWNATIVGALVVALAAIDLDTPAAWDEWTMGALGLWLVIAPWALGYAGHRWLTSLSVGVGVLVVASSAWALRDLGALPHRSGTAH